MKLRLSTTVQKLNKAYQKEKINRSDFEQFGQQLQIISNKIDSNEGEEHLKNYIIQFLKNTFYEKHEVNTKGRTNLAIYNGESNQATAGVLFEVKKAKSPEMITKTDVNKKALHEIILYYLTERIEHNNNEIKNIVVTNSQEWFIIDAIDFERLFFTTELTNEYKKWRAGQKTSKSTKLFYTEIAAKFIENNDAALDCVYLNFEEYNNTEKANENQRINLYKFFSPQHLLKLPATNDSNTLDGKFYNELLHIIGLEEAKVNNKKVIKRKPESERNPASLIENTINILGTEDRLKHIEDIEKRFGTHTEEQIFGVALELNIVWINRILFLKLLEAQLVQYHAGSSEYVFLNTSTIADFDQLNELFFEVPAKKPNVRDTHINQKFKHIPYLNSSLFEISKLEDETIRINSLKSRLKMTVSPKTVLKNKGEMTLLEYLFSFLNAYDFTSEGRGKIQEENKNLINAAVLGLIFEKINGYKDGSFFTPGYITMYMSRKNIREAVLQKFEEAGYQLSSTLDLSDSVNELKDKIEDRKKANEIINSLKICDPAVGSGHFLVSALNEIIALKSELGILEYRNGNRIKNYKIDVVNDELIVTDKETDELFEYTLSEKGNVIDYKQDLQEALFHEKQNIIENCLFGVDINANSVNICRLRLWIELLKNSYYTYESNYTELETLPNIDINIKQGDSLVGRFALNGGSPSNSQAQKMKIATERYKAQVIVYKASNDKKTKKSAEQEIKNIKEKFATSVNPADKDYILLRQKRTKLGETPMLFSIEDKERWQKEIEQLAEEVIDLEKKYAEKLDTLYNNAFEWRFEFPEVLDANGNFVGFDVVIGNPPYISGRDFNLEQDFLKLHLNSMYEIAEYQLDLYQLFIEKAHQIAKNKAQISYIIPNTWLANHKTKKTRNFLLDHLSVSEIVYSQEKVFAEADVDAIIFCGTKGMADNKLKVKQITKQNVVCTHVVDFQSFRQNDNQVFDIYVSKIEKNIIKKVEQEQQTIKDLFRVNRGIHPYRKDGYGESKYTKGVQTTQDYENRSYHATHRVDKTYRPELKGRHIFPYYIIAPNEFVSYGKWLAEPRDPSFFAGERIYLRKIVGERGLIANIIVEAADFVADQSIYIAKPQKSVSLEFVLAQLNSKLLGYYFRLKNNEFDHLFPQIKVDEFKKLPIKTDNCNEKGAIIELVGKIMQLKSEDANADITHLTNEIDRLVYTLYELSEAEIKHIEQNYIVK